jgi:hypothetical protein
MRTRMAKSERAAIATICSRSARDSLFCGTVRGPHRPSWELSPLKRSLGNTDYLTLRVLAHHARRSRPPTARVHDPTRSRCVFASAPLIKSIFLENPQRRCFGQCIVFSQNPALQEEVVSPRNLCHTSSLSQNVQGPLRARPWSEWNTGLGSQL